MDLTNCSNPSSELPPQACTGDSRHDGCFSPSAFLLMMLFKKVLNDSIPCVCCSPFWKVIESRSLVALVCHLEILLSILLYLWVWKWLWNNIMVIVLKEKQETLNLWVFFFVFVPLHWQYVCFLFHVVFTGTLSRIWCLEKCFQSKSPSQHVLVTSYHHRTVKKKKKIPSLIWWQANKIAWASPWGEIRVCNPQELFFTCLIMLQHESSHLPQLSLSLICHKVKTWVK